MIFRPATGVTVSMSHTGWLELVLPPRKTRVQCDGYGTAMWIALRQHGGCVGDAAKTLSEVWSVDLLEMRFVMYSWVDDLRTAGMLQTDVPVRVECDPGSRSEASAVIPAARRNRREW